MWVISCMFVRVCDDEIFFCRFVFVFPIIHSPPHSNVILCSPSVLFHLFKSFCSRASRFHVIYVCCHVCIVCLYYTMNIFASLTANSSLFSLVFSVSLSYVIFGCGWQRGREHGWVQVNAKLSVLLRVYICIYISTVNCIAEHIKLVKIVRCVRLFSIPNADILFVVAIG